MTDHSTDATKAQASSTAAVDDANKVFAGNLAFSTTEDELKQVFSEAGTVTFIQIIKRGTRSLGYGFVTYQTEAEAQKAVSLLDKREIAGREINVEGAKPQDPQSKSQDAELAANGDEGADGNASGGKRGRGRGRNARGRGRGKQTTASRRPRADEGEEGLEDPIAENGALDGDAKTNGDASKASKRSQKGTARQPRKPKGPPEGEPSKTLLFVANLPYEFSDEQLLSAFEGLQVKTAKVIKRPYGNRTKGYGFVDMESEADQQRALNEVHGKSIKGRAITLKVAIQGDDRKAEEDGREKVVANAEQAAEADPAPAA